MSKIKAKATLKLNAYHILMERVEAGLRYGWHRAHKHTDKPDMEAILNAQEEAVSNEIAEILDQSE